MDEKQVDQEISRLYGLPLTQFIQARSDLERTLRSEGDAGAAGRVKAVRKPSLSAWAVNQLARTRAKQVQDLIRLGDEVRQAERRALGGGGGARLQEAGGNWRKLVEELSKVAEEILQAAGHSPSRSHLDQVQNTLLATATDQQVRDQVSEGRLEKEAQPPSGFGALAEAAGGTLHQLKPARPEPQDRKRERARERAEELERQANEAESEARRLRQELAEAEQRTRKARTAADRAEAKASTARERAARATLETR